MLKLLKYCLWIVVVLALTIGFDQLMVKLPLRAPGLTQTQAFYLDFRSRLLNLNGRSSAAQKDAIEKVIEQSSTAKAQKSAKITRYLYVDENGALQFADNLQQVPVKYRQKAQPLAE
jgi:hypothetical protein